MTARPTPVALPRAGAAGPAVARALSCGERHTSCLGKAGELWGWGSNLFAQLGDSSVGDASSTGKYVYSPMRIGPQTNWGRVSVGYDFVAALTAW
jgi:alpha-tubulin suppressor-like RCC1 family protein